MRFNQQIDDLLDQLSDDDSDQVERELQIYDTNDIVAVMAKRLLDAEGADGGLAVIGPFTIAHDDAGWSDNQLTLAALPAGTIVLQAFASVSEVFDNGTEQELILMVGGPDAEVPNEDWASVVGYDATTSAGGTGYTREGNLARLGSVSQAVVLTADGFFLANASGPLSAGHATAYALVVSP